MTRLFRKLIYHKLVLEADPQSNITKKKKKSLLIPLKFSSFQQTNSQPEKSNAGGNPDTLDGDPNADGDEQIYWLRPKLRSSPGDGTAGGAPGQAQDKSWLNKKLKQKVTFNDLPSTSGSR